RTTTSNPSVGFGTHDPTQDKSTARCMSRLMTWERTDQAIIDHSRVDLGSAGNTHEPIGCGRSVAEA
ncbi:MAG: hypothetical protein VYC98_00460, partial [Planctomycetota bacterium]|nr:hypothetical protein [Planctomycetota bacterium]